MKKKLICFATSMIIATGTCIPVMAAGVTATPNKASVAVDGNAIAIGAYNINGYNYFKLRDIAAALNGTDVNFEVGYDTTAKSIALSSNSAYSATGNELKDTAPTAKKTAIESNQKIILDGAEVSMQAYLIDGYNYFQLRELGKNLGFDVAWDNTSKAINMVTNSTSATPVTPVSPNEDAVKAKNVIEEIQESINTAEEGNSVYLVGTYEGNPGDKLVINKSLKLYCDEVTFKNISIEVNTDKYVIINGITFEGNKSSEPAIHIKNAGTDSAIKFCTFQNYMSDVIIIDKIVNGAKMTFAYNNFIDFGLAETKVDGAIALNATENSTAYYQLEENLFKLAKDIDVESKMDVAVVTRDVANAPEIYKNTYIAFINNVIDKANSPGVGIDMYSDIPHENVFSDYFE